MRITAFKNTSVSAFAFVFLLFASAPSFGGGGGGGGNTGDLPPPNPCNSDCGFEIGPAPSPSSVSSQGPLPITTANVPRSVDGFGGGTIYYPTNISTAMAAIALAPGFTQTQSSFFWWAPTLASHGFVVITIDTNSRFDQPASRGRQLDSALSYLIAESARSNSPISGLVDETRLATMGHSMGGGGSLHSASRNRLSAAVPLAPWNSGGNNFSDIDVPTLIIACQSDAIAPVIEHASPFYEVIPGSTDKAFMEIVNGEHACNIGRVEDDRASLATYGVSWMKRFLDKDRRYAQFLCGPNHEENASISNYRDTCDYL